MSFYTDKTFLQWKVIQFFYEDEEIFYRFPIDLVHKCSERCVLIWDYILFHNVPVYIEIMDNHHVLWHPFNSKQRRCVNGKKCIKKDYHVYFRSSSPLHKFPLYWWILKAKQPISKKVKSSILSKLTALYVCLDFLLVREFCLPARSCFFLRSFHSISFGTRAIERLKMEFIFRPQSIKAGASFFCSIAFFASHRDASSSQWSEKVQVFYLFLLLVIPHFVLWE